MKNKYIKLVIIFLVAIMTSLSFTLNYSNNINQETLTYINILTMSLFAITIFFVYKKYYLLNRKYNIYFIILSLLFAIFMIFGYSYKLTDSWNLVFSSKLYILFSIIKLIGLFSFFNMLLHSCYEFINKNISKDIKVSKRIKYYLNELPFRTSFVIIILCWIPYIIAFYPAILSPDPSYQIKQYMGIKTKYIDYSIALDENVTITNHHPVTHTILLGGSVELGHKLFDSTNVGLFIYSIIQIIILASCLALTIKFMSKLKSPYYLRIISLVIYALVPVFPLYAMSAVKDVIFSALIIIYIFSFYYLIRNNNEEKYSFKNIISLIVLLLLIMLMRNNGIYVIVLSFPFLLLIERKNIVKVLIILIVPLTIYQSYTKILLPHFKITDGSIREALSIPFQQTARYVKENKDSLTEHEIKVIDNVLGIDDLASRYKPEISDPVKNKFNKYTTNEELSEYFKVWFDGLTKHPDTYIQSFINNTYGYYYPDKTNWYIYHKYDKRLSQEEMFNYSYNNLDGLRSVLSGYGEVFPYIPILGLIVNIGFSVWVYMYMLAVFLHRKCYKFIIFLLPTISLILVCLASPVNTYFRYAMPYIFALPVSIAIFSDIIKRTKSN